MSIRNILSAYSGEAARGSGLRHAAKLATHHGAWLTGVLRHGRSALERRYRAHVPDSLLDQLRAADDQLIEEVAGRFADVTGEAGLEGRSEFVDLDPATHGNLPEFARTFDLIVTGVHSVELKDEHLSASPDTLALNSGRPVLVVPNGYDAPGLAEHALVAWDGSRAAARAIGDAMPILEDRARVTVLSVGKEAPRDTDRLMISLSRHGIAASHMQRPHKGPVGENILKAAEDVGARLVVMGCFEHHKFTHTLFGGLTTDVTRDATVPVFLSH